jgi:oligopeptide/dipeptide ABC transporter ATP-binding protein
MSGSSPSREPVLRVEGLSTEFATPGGSVRAVDGVSFEIPPGAAVGLVGESGSGKSTVALSILRLLGPGGRITGGRILFRGEDLLAKSPDELQKLRGNRLATVFQDPLTTLTPSLTIGEQIAETILAHRSSSRRAAWGRAVELLGQVGVPDAASRARQYPHHLSGGMRQRVSIAIALSCDPDLVILDEPTTALDVTVQAQILELLDRLRGERHLSMLFISHDLGVIARVCDAVCVLYGGRIVEQSPVEALFRGPLHPYAKGLLACVPGLGGATKRRLPHIAGRVPDLVDPPAGCIFEPRCPFAEARCREPQPLRTARDGRRVACWRFEALAGTEWPAGPPESMTERRPAAAGAALSTVGLSKDYPLSGFWDSVRLVRSGTVLPRLRWDHRRLRAVDDVSLSLAPGETLGLVGESGCGKSTYSRMLVGLVTPTRGEIRMNGQRVDPALGDDRRRFRRDVQIVFQDPESSLNPRKRVGEILGRPLVLYDLARGRRVGHRVGELLHAVGLPAAYAARYSYQLSGGEKQRVGIARALAAEPRFVVCDEPVSALDVSVRASILNLLGDLQRQLGLAYLFIAHDLAVVRQISDRVAVMYRGRVCEQGTVAEIFAPPHHPYTWALLSAVPVPDPTARARPRTGLMGSVTSRRPDQRGCVFEDRCPVKIGAICEDTTPPRVTVSPTHWIACHHPVAILETLDPAVPRTGRDAPVPSQS